jgi:hypothetical protein
MVDSPVEPRLFDLFDKHIAAVERGDLKADSVLKKEAHIIVFCQTVFAQFFESQFGYEIKSIDEQTKEQATRIRIGLENDPKKDAIRKLVRSFEELCDLWQDVLGFGYGGSTGEFQAFHRKYVPRLLGRLHKYADENQHAELAQRCGETLARYKTVMGKL